jgi:hypothetical protein
MEDSSSVLLPSFKGKEQETVLETAKSIGALFEIRYTIYSEQYTDFNF